MKGVRIEDLNPKYHEQIKRQLGVGNPTTAPERKPAPPEPAIEPERRPTKVTKTESAYLLWLLLCVPKDSHILYNAITLRMLNGHKYTADYVVIRTDGVIELHEVKGSYKLHSYQRARLAFDQARIEFPCFKFVWATRRKDGGWEVE